MKRSKMVCFFIIISALLFLPQIRPVHAEDKPSYVGVDVNDVFIWKVTIEPDAFEDFYEDAGASDTWIDNYSDWFFDDEWDKDIEAWKIVIVDMNDEKEFDYKGDDNDKVVYYLNWYTTEDYDEKDWDEEEMNARGAIVKYDKDYYTDRSLGLLGLYYAIAANNINWDKLADEVDEELDDEYDGDDQDGSAKKLTSGYKDNGISTSFNVDDEEFDDFDTIAKYNDDGVVMYYEWSYDGDPIIILELEGQIFYEYWHIILGITVIGVVSVVVVVVVVKKLRAR